MNDETREKLAALAHEQWAYSARHILTELDPNENGELAEYFPAVARWERQIYSSYAELAEPEKDIYRSWADKAIEIVRAAKADTGEGQ